MAPDASSRPPPSRRSGATQAAPDDPEAAAMAAATRLLGVRERSGTELQRRLRDKGFDAETVLRVIDRLQSAGLQDDRRFAEGFAAAATDRRGLAGRVVQRELRLRGIEKETAAEIASRSPEEELAAARALAERRAARLAAYPPDVKARRIAAYLTGRGYSQEVCAEALKAVLGDAMPE